MGSFLLFAWTNGPDKLLRQRMQPWYNQSCHLGRGTISIAPSKKEVLIRRRAYATEILEDFLSILIRASVQYILTRRPVAEDKCHVCDRFTSRRKPVFMCRDLISRWLPYVRLFFWTKPASHSKE